MPVHDALYAGGCLRSISSVSRWYPLVGIPIAVCGHTAPTRQTGPFIAPENWYVGETLAGLQLQRGSIRDGHIGGEQTRIPPGPYGPALRNGLW